MRQPRCRYYPSCSTYAVGCAAVHGPLRGSALAAGRVLRCHPWSPGGIDHVPPSRGETGERSPSSSVPSTIVPDQPCDPPSSLESKMREFGQSVLGVFSSILEFIHDLVEPLFGVHSWGWAIIGLTLLARILLLPLAIKQTRSMKAMQQLQPQMKAIQDKYKTDREMMRKDPEKYRARKQKQQQEMMALYQREGANPAASCLPLLAQAPIFLALFWTLRDEPELMGAPFYFITGSDGRWAREARELRRLAGLAPHPADVRDDVPVAEADDGPQRGMMADNPMAQQQKILLYVMPVFLAVVSFQFPLGILLYWVTTNLWQIAQQAIILREGTKKEPTWQHNEVAASARPSRTWSGTRSSQHCPRPWTSRPDGSRSA
jgi:YidC/Oxa1 family membrane protein insertase